MERFILEGIDSLELTANDKFASTRCERLLFASLLFGIDRRFGK
jgi:hypothetical protein